MERFQEKCVFRGLLFYWYKVSIFNHTQSMRVLTILFSNLTMDETSSALSHGATYYACLLLFSLWMKSFVVTIQMKAPEQYFPVVLFITFCKRVLTFESVDKFLL